ncbi:imidazolonepropionase [Halobellus salinus]|uniref:Imidazolonepropionase n=1 Tax=Halobellus salinus TaxID=931585 RepID=A0A830EH40_9EURY|nr:imidazolonepropionase [Halobellus salinus]GGJ11255.1 imidazolonepropionase [Halobellus salinus]SMP03803.1 imidazolonepropionase [Halobellus salinus]
MTEYTLVHDAAQLVRNGDNGLDTVSGAAVAVEDGHVVAAGPTDEVVRAYPGENAVVAVDAGGKTVLPGFVDPHTHAVFAGDRADEFTDKLRGKTYQEIAAAGGGILRTVRAVREATRETLVENLLSQLDGMLAHGTTTAEVKSGYGLRPDTETKLLEAIREADDRHPIDLVPTFMGAHAVPDDWSTDDYVDHVIEDQLPVVADRGLAEFCDVFCEAGIFSVEQSRRILTAGRDYGLTPKVHAEEFERIGGAELAAELGAASADHLLEATAADAQALARADVVPVLLPGTAFALAADYADPDQFAAAGAEVAIATDFNPNCFSQSMEFAVDLACHGMRMEPGSAIRAATVGAAAAITRRDGLGRLREGHPGDLVIADVPDCEHLPYNFGVSTVETVLKAGEVVYDAR